MAWGALSDTRHGAPQFIALGPMRLVATGLLDECFSWAAGNPPPKAGDDVLVPVRQAAIIHLDCPVPLADILAALRRVGLLRRRTKTHPTWGECLAFTVPADLLHLMSVEESEANRSSRVPSDLQLRVLARDGDQCRWCGIAVIPTAGKGGRRRHFDHVDPAGKHELSNVVVSCNRCNEEKGALPRDRSQLLTPPMPLYFHPQTRRALEAACLITSATHGGPSASTIATRGGTPRKTAERNTAGSNATSAVDQTSTKRPPKPDHPRRPEVDRVGQGQAGSGGRARGGRRNPRSP